MTGEEGRREGILSMLELLDGQELTRNSPLDNVRRGIVHGNMRDEQAQRELKDDIQGRRKRRKGAVSVVGRDTAGRVVEIVHKEEEEEEDDGGGMGEESGDHIRASGVKVAVMPSFLVGQHLQASSSSHSILPSSSHSSSSSSDTQNLPSSLKTAIIKSNNLLNSNKETDGVEEGDDEDDEDIEWEEG